MTVVESLHDEHGATFREVGEHRVVDDYGRPERAHRAVRNGVGVVEMGYGVLEIRGDDRIEYVDDAVSNRVPAGDGRGCYALLLDPQGRIETELYVYNADERLLAFTPPGEAAPLAEEWRSKTFIQDVEIDIATGAFGVFGVHGPNATEKVASVLSATAPDEQLSFVRGRLDRTGITVIRGDGLAGEEEYEVVCSAADAGDVFDTLLTRGMNAAPFGYRTRETLTLEAGTPLFASELEGRVANSLGLRNGLDFEKGCFVGQEVVSRIENRGQPARRLVGLRPDAVPEAGAAVFAGDESIGEVTRAAVGPSLDAPAALALVDFGFDGDEVTVRVEGGEHAADIVELPFVEGSERSARLPEYG